MVGSPSEVLESGQNIDDDTDLKDPSLFMLNTDIESAKISNEEIRSLTPDIVIKTEIEEPEPEPENENESDTLERFIIVEEAVEEVTTTYDEHILEICQEDDNMDTDQYEDYGYESLSSPEYEYKTQYTPHLLTDILLREHLST